MKDVIGDLTFASGWLAIGLAIAWRQRRRHSAQEPMQETTAQNPHAVLPDHDLAALALAAGDSVAIESEEALAVHAR
jgi:hypothetical protein